MTTRATLLTQRLTLFAALDATIFAEPAAMPVLTARYEATFAAYRQALQVFPAAETCRCELCLASFEAAELAPLDKDYTYDRAVQQYSFNRLDLLCRDCRNDCEAEFGCYASDEADDADWSDR